MRQKSRLRDFENRVLRRIFGNKRNKGGAGEWRTQNEEFNDFYSSANIIRVIKSRRLEIGRACGTYGTKEWCIQGFDRIRGGGGDRLEDTGAI
jgi:hypothetical protein